MPPASRNGIAISKTKTPWVTTVLEVPKDMERHALQNGARYDSALKQWFLWDEVPEELITFIPEPARAISKKIDPLCPLCRSHMRIRTFRGHDFWACSAHSRNGCRGRISLEDALDAQPKPLPRHVADFFPKAEKNKPQEITKTQSPIKSMPAEFLSAFTEIAQLAQEVLKVDPNRWLESVRVGLGYQKPIDLMKTLDGCRMVCDLLHSIKQQR